MKFIHTADWHLGKSLKNQSLIEDQYYILQEFLKLVDAENPDAIVIAGDIYDRSIPPVDAVNLFDEVIFKIVEKKIPVLCISGNHDSAARLNFGSRLFERSKFFIETLPNEKPKNVILNDEFGEVYFSLIPFFEPVEMQDKISAEKVDANAANKFYIEEARKNIPANKRSVAVAHLFVTGGKISESERKFVGAVENVSAENFSSYNYTALGHLHKPQTMKKTGYVVRYSGSLLKYSFDEVNYSKGITIVNIDGKGETSFEHKNLTPRRDVRIVEGTMEELRQFERTEDYIHANLTDKNHVLNAMEKLRNSAFPNILSIKFVNLENEIENANATLREDVSIIEQFADFYEYSTGEKLEGDYRSTMENILNELKTGDKL